jgi:hypothetical protein
VKKESKFQSDLKTEINERLPGCMILKNDPTHYQGIPDLLILYEDTWAALECKRDEGAEHQPNQDYYVEHMNDMSYASFINPQNKERVLDEMESTLRNKIRRSRVSRSQQVSLAKLRRSETG